MTRQVQMHKGTTETVRVHCGTGLRNETKTASVGTSKKKNRVGVRCPVCRLFCFFMLHRRRSSRMTDFSAFLTERDVSYEHHEQNEDCFQLPLRELGCLHLGGARGSAGSPALSNIRDVALVPTQPQSKPSQNGLGVPLETEAQA